MWASLPLSLISASSTQPVSCQRGGYCSAFGEKSTNSGAQAVLKCLRVFLSVCLYVCIYVCMYVCILFVCFFVSIYVCMYVYIFCKYVNIYMYV